MGHGQRPQSWGMMHLPISPRMSQSSPEHNDTKRRATLHMGYRGKGLGATEQITYNTPGLAAGKAEPIWHEIRRADGCHSDIDFSAVACIVLRRPPA